LPRHLGDRLMIRIRDEEDVFHALSQRLDLRRLHDDAVLDEDLANPRQQPRAVQGDHLEDGDVLRAVGTHTGFCGDVERAHAPRRQARHDTRAGAVRRQPALQEIGDMAQALRVFDSPSGCIENEVGVQTHAVAAVVDPGIVDTQVKLFQL
jgi:hypothetical protein